MAGYEAERNAIAAAAEEKRLAAEKAIADSKLRDTPTGGTMDVPSSDGIVNIPKTATAAEIIESEARNVQNTVLPTTWNDLTNLVNPGKRILGYRR